MSANLKITGKVGQICLGVAYFLSGLSVSADEVDVSKLPPPAEVRVQFARDIQPILEANCLRCHGPEKSKSGLRLDNRRDALKGGEKGRDILAGNSAESPLIHYTAYLVDSMEMPPVGKGQRLASNEIALLRAWIDQGAAWSSTVPTNRVAVSVSPILGGTAVKGDNQKFREHYWEADGVNGGLEKFEVFDRSDPDTTVSVTGHVLLHDYKLQLAEDTADRGFIHAGWEEYRKYYDDTGGYFPAASATPQKLGSDLYLDIGRAWVDLGLTRPGLPKMTLGYEYDYRHGNEATTEWGAVNSSIGQRNIAPASESISEGVHILKFDLDHEINGIAIEDRFRGEFYNLKTGNSNFSYDVGPQTVTAGTTYFQGANTLRLEKKFSNWFFGSAGYLYSKLNADSTFNMNVPAQTQQAGIPRITLEKDSNVANLNGLIGPLEGFTLSTGALAELSHQQGFGAGTYVEENPPPLGNLIFPFNLASDYNETSLQETASLRYSKIPFSALFAEVRLEQQSIGQYDQFSATQDILNKAVFLQNTDFASRSSDLRAGFNTSPWRPVSFNVQYRRYDDHSAYDSGPLVQPSQTAYPTFIRARDMLTDEVEAKLVLHPSTHFQTSLSCQYRTTEYDVTTGSYIVSGNAIAPGGQLIAGEDHSQVFSINGMLTPAPRFYLTAMLSFQPSSTITAVDGSPSVVPYRGDTYTALANGTYILTKTSQLFMGYSFSEATYAQNDFAGGLPLGMDYHRYDFQVGISRKFGDGITGKLQYRFNYYNEPTSGGADNYTAHSVFGMVAFKWP